MYRIDETAIKPAVTRFAAPRRLSIPGVRTQPRSISGQKGGSFRNTFGDPVAGDPCNLLYPLGGGGNAGGCQACTTVVMSRARSLFIDAMLGVTSLCTVMAGASIISPDVRAQLVAAMAGDATGQLSAIASRAFDFVHTYFSVVGDFGGDNMPLAGCGILAVVLAFMMFRM